MTHHTDAELLPCPFCGDHAETDFIPEHHSYAIECHSMGCAARVIKDTASDAIEAWNRRAPAAPVPQFSRIAQKKLDYLLEAGEAITGYAIENKDGRRGAIDCHGFVYWWQDAAAPQPPEAAPVQLPEPFTTLVRKNSWAPNSYEAAPRSNHQDYGRQWADERINVFTEQQVRDLLAVHGLGKDKA